MLKKWASKLRQARSFGSLGKYKAIAFSFAVAALAMAFTVAAPTPTQAAPVSFTGTVLPFTVPDMLGTAVNFLTMYGEWVLLAIGVIFAPVLYGLAIKLAAAARARSAK